MELEKENRHGYKTNDHGCSGRQKRERKKKKKKKIQGNEKWMMNKKPVGKKKKRSIRTQNQLIAGIT